jgi:hypothetical protein
MPIIKIQVTERDIAVGHRHDSCLCPIARALRRRLKGRPLVSVGAEVCSVGDSGPRVLLPKEAQEFIKRFDERLPVNAFEFDLDTDRRVTWTAPTITIF